LHLTVINMGKEAFPLKSGDRIMRLLLLRDDKQLGGVGQSGRSLIDDQLLARLSPDFLDVDSRADAAAARAVSFTDLRLKNRQVWVPVVTAILVAFLGWLASSGVREQLSLLDQKVAVMHEQLNPSSGNVALQNLSNRIALIERRLDVSKTQGKATPK